MQLYKTKRFTSPPVRAVFPDLSKPDQFGKFKISVDLLNHPEFEEILTQQADQCVAEAQAKLETKKKPASSTSFIKDGEYKDVPYRRVSFSMNSSRKARKGDEVVEVPQKPLIVDASLKPMNKIVWGGSLVRVSYQMQFTISNFGVHVKPVLVGVQVLELVGPSGEVRATDLFSAEEGYVDDGETPEVTEAAEDEDSVDDTIKDGRDF